MWKVIDLAQIPMPTQQGNKGTKSQGITSSGLRLNLYFYLFPRKANHSSATKAMKKGGDFCFLFPLEEERNLSLNKIMGRKAE